jgi:hypothetical protein
MHSICLTVISSRESACPAPFELVVHVQNLGSVWCVLRKPSRQPVRAKGLQHIPEPYARDISARNRLLLLYHHAKTSAITIPSGGRAVSRILSRCRACVGRWHKYAGDVFLEFLSKCARRCIETRSQRGWHYGWNFDWLGSATAICIFCKLFPCACPGVGRKNSLRLDARSPINGNWSSATQVWGNVSSARRRSGHRYTRHL